MFCLDTSIIILIFNDRRPGVARSAQRGQDAGPVMIPSIVLFELMYGVAKSERPDGNRAVLDSFLFSIFQTLDFDAADATEAGSIRAALERRGTPIGAYDVLIAAQVRRRGAVLVTENQREFARVPGLMVTDWAR